MTDNERALAEARWWTERMNEDAPPAPDAAGVAAELAGNPAALAEMTDAEFCAIYDPLHAEWMRRLVEASKRVTAADIAEACLRLADTDAARLRTDPQ